MQEPKKGGQGESHGVWVLVPTKPNWAEACLDMWLCGQRTFMSTPIFAGGAKVGPFLNKNVQS
jgi:hypothetical protein